MNKDALLSVRDLSVGFMVDSDLMMAVEGVSFDLLPGESLALVGESGSGKSVTALSVMRLLSRSSSRIISGEIWFRHPRKGCINLLHLKDEEMQAVRGRYISMVFQEPMTSLNPVMRCGNQVIEVLARHQRAGCVQAREQVLSLFSEVRLPEPQKVFRAWPHELSGGQKQRVMIAMAMACKPALLIADEPTTALDVTVQKSILDLIKSLRKKYGMAVLFISHDLGVVKQVADRAVVMRNGSVLDGGTVEDLFLRPEHPYTKALLACRPPLDARPKRLPVVDDFMHTAGRSTQKNEMPSGGQMKTPKPWMQNNDEGREPDFISIEEKADRHETVPLLEVRKLHTYFVSRKNLWGKPLDHFKAVEDISFKLYRGETLGLVGESGCGKTTLGRSIMRLLTPNAGQVFFMGRDIARMSAGELRHLRPKFQIIFQDPYGSLTPGISIGSAIMEPMRVHKVLKNNRARKKRIMDLLLKVGLQEEHYDRYPHEFSGGQRQRVCIARALALEPEFLVCDESVSALDVSVQAQVLNLLNELKEEFGLTFLFISHDLSVVKYMSDRIMVMKNGRLEEINDADELYKNPQSDYTKTLIDAIPDL